MSRIWTDEDIKILKEYYPSHGVELTARKLNRSINSIRHKVSRLNIKLSGDAKYYSWEPWKINYLKENFAHKTNEELSGILGKPVTYIRDVGYKMGLKKAYLYNIWTDEQVNLLINNIEQCSLSELEKILNKPEQTIKKKIYELELREELLDDGRYTPTDLANIVGMHYHAIRNYCVNNSSRYVDKVTFLGRINYRFTIRQAVICLHSKIKYWINNDFDLLAINMMFLDKDAIYYCRKEVEEIKEAIERKRGKTSWADTYKNNFSRGDAA